jgi:hypothetical protein
LTITGPVEIVHLPVFPEKSEYGCEKIVAINAILEFYIFEDICHILTPICDLTREREFFAGSLHHLESPSIMYPASSDEDMDILISHIVYPISECIDHSSKCPVDMGEVGDSTSNNEVFW